MGTTSGGPPGDVGVPDDTPPDDTPSDEDVTILTAADAEGTFTITVNEDVVRTGLAQEEIPGALIEVRRERDLPVTEDLEAWAANIETEEG